MKKYFVLLVIGFVFFVGCKTTETKDNSDNSEGLRLHSHYTNADGTINKDSWIEFINSFNFSEDMKRDFIEHIKTLPDDTVLPFDTSGTDIELPSRKELIKVFPNPTLGAVTVEFFIKGLSNTITLDLYYNNRKINTLEFANVKDNKIVISSDYLKENGTYTISLNSGLASTSFVVKK